MSIGDSWLLERYNESFAITKYKSGNDEILAKNCSEVLEKSFPGYLWAVHVNEREGFVDLFNLNISGQHGFSIKLNGFYSWDSIRDKVMRAGGEILERHKLPRERWNQEKYDDTPRNIKGLPAGDLSK